MNDLEQLLINEIYNEKNNKFKITFNDDQIQIIDTSVTPSQAYSVDKSYFSPKNRSSSEFANFVNSLVNCMSSEDKSMVTANIKTISAMIKFFEACNFEATDNNIKSTVSNAQYNLKQLVNLLRSCELASNNTFLKKYHDTTTRPSIAKTASTSSFRTGGPTTPTTGASIQRPTVERKPGKQLPNTLKNIPPEDTVIEYEKIYIRSLKDAWKSFLAHDTDLQTSGIDVDFKASTISHNFIQKAKKINNYDYDNDPKAFSKFQNDSDRNDLVEFISDYEYKQLNTEQCDFNDAKCNLFKTELYATTGEHLLTFETIDQDDKWVKAQYTIGKYADDCYTLTSSPEKFEQRLLIMQFIAEQTVKINKRLNIDNKDVNVPSFFITAEGDNIDDRIIVAYFLMMHKCVIPVFGDQTEAFKTRLVELNNKDSKGTLTENEATILKFAKEINTYKNELGGDTLFDDKANPATIKNCLEKNIGLIHRIYDPLISKDSLLDANSKNIIADALKRYEKTEKNGIDAYPDLSQTYDGKQSKIIIQAPDIPGNVTTRVDPTAQPNVTLKPKGGKSKKLW